MKKATGTKNTEPKKEETTQTNISSTIKSIQDIMRKDDGVDGDAQRIGQLTWMLFLKIFDQREEEWEDDAADSQRKYISPIPEKCRWRNWAAYIKDKEGKKQPQIAGNAIIPKVNNEIFPNLGDIYEQILSDLRSETNLLLHGIDIPDQVKREKQPICFLF